MINFFLPLKPQPQGAKLTHPRTVFNRTDMNPEQSFIDKQINVTSMMLVSSIAIIIYILCSTLREFLQIYQQKWQYLFEPNNFISWMLYISAGIMVSPVFNGGWITDCHFSAASLAVFLSWFNLLLFLQRFDQVSKSGISIRMDHPSQIYFSIINMNISNFRSAFTW